MGRFYTNNLYSPWLQMLGKKCSCNSSLQQKYGLIVHGYRAKHTEANENADTNFASTTPNNTQPLYSGHIPTSSLQKGKMIQLPQLI